MTYVLFLALSLAGPSTVLRGGTIYDGSGGSPLKADIRIERDTITEVGTVAPRPGDRVIRVSGLAVSPGFIDAHSHADGGVFKDPDCENHIRQGITTSVVGQDGFSHFPVADFFGNLKSHPVALNFASFVGHGTLRHKVIGDVDRKATPEEIQKMKDLVGQEMQSGAIGLSTGLEYVPNRYANTDEIVDLASEAARFHGIYISHVRNEDNYAFEAFRELIEIARRAKISAEINHIKLCSSRVWHRAPEVTAMMAAARKEGLDITADVYPYTYWQSTIRVIIPTEHFGDRAQWEQGFKDVGGPAHVLLTSYSPNPKWAGHTLAEISSETRKDPITVAQTIVQECYGSGHHGEESVVATAMSEDDVRTFIADPYISFCTDGALHGTHPRGAGSFPRDLGLYVRQEHLISLPEAIRKMTALPAWRFGFRDRGHIAAGYKADLVVFDPDRVIDTATTKSPESKPVGIPDVFVNGVAVMLNGRSTGARPGRPLLRDGASSTVSSQPGDWPPKDDIQQEGGGGGG